ncbi:unnamed protein product [Caenorhabditis sp. 36 PRJEB53466]|nr:unnamed protein product [Caenorhabditis sp. 36 PRJEB53466]
MLSPVASTAPTPSFIARHCPHHNTTIAFARHSSGAVQKFAYFDGFFAPIECAECRLAPTEKDLHPLYTVWSTTAGKYVIFARNNLTNSVEQFIYNGSMNAFQQVDWPHIVYDPLIRHTQSDILFTTQPTIKCGVTVIQRHPRGHLMKQQYCKVKQQFEECPDAPVVSLWCSEKPEKSEKKAAEAEKLVTTATIEIQTDIATTADQYQDFIDIFALANLAPDTVSPSTLNQSASVDTLSECEESLSDEFDVLSCSSSQGSHNN